MIRLVLAYDHCILRAGLRALLESRADVTIVSETRNGREAVDLAAQLRPDVVVMDAVLPGLSGQAAIRRIANEGSGARVLILTAGMSNAQVQSTLEAGAAGYLTKDSTAEELFAALDAVVGGKHFLTPSVVGSVVGVLSRRDRAVPQATMRLTQRELEVLQLIAEGQSTKEVAATLGIAPRTAGTHRSSLMGKLGLHKAPDLVRFAIREGVIAP